MNPHTNEFEAETAETPKEWERFAIGESVTVKGVKFVIEAIGKRELKLRPWTRVDEMTAGYPKAETFTQRLERTMAKVKP